MQQYKPDGRAFVCDNGQNRYSRALYGGWSDYRIETSDMPVFAIVKKEHYRNLRFEIEGVPLEEAEYIWSSYEDGIRTYVLMDKRWNRFGKGIVRLKAVAMHDEEGAIFEIVGDKWEGPFRIKYKLNHISNVKLSRNGDLGIDPPENFDAPAGEPPIATGLCPSFRNFAHLVIKLDEIAQIGDITATEMYNNAVKYNHQMASRVVFSTPDPFINTLGGALVMAADGDWDGKTWLHGCIGWRMPLAGWRAAYVGDVLGWNERAESHFNAYAKSQVTNVPPTIPHPTQDKAMNLARAEKQWGTQMYSNGYICRNPERDNQMHHYDMNLNYIDELLWHFQYNADKDYMRKMWPVIKAHLAWEKRNFDPDGDHLYDAYCCIWASDALYYSGGAVTHSSAYNYRANRLAARIAELLGDDPTPFKAEAEAILKAMNERLWLSEKGHWAEYQDALGYKRLHESAAVWSVYTPIDCGAGTPEQFYRATQYIDREIPHIDVEDSGYQTISTTNWMPYSWSINNVAPAEVMHTALAYYEAGRPDAAFALMKANILDNMYYGQSPANFGQLSHLDAARGECYRDFGDCIGISSRTLLQGLFGIIPNALYGECIIRPGFPSDWQKASLKTPYMEYTYQRTGNKVRLEITQNFAQRLKIIVRQNLGGGKYRDIQGNSDQIQTIEYEYVAITPDITTSPKDSKAATSPATTYDPDEALRMGLANPVPKKSFKRVNINLAFNANVTDIFNNRYETPRPQTTTLQIPLQGVGEWCHPNYRPTIDDSGIRSLAGKRGIVVVAGVPFRTPKQGKNIIYTSLWDNYPNQATIPLTGRASSAYLLMAGSTNHMQSYIENGEVIVTYVDGTTDKLPLVNPHNWCPIEQDYFLDGKAFLPMEPCPYRICLSNGTVSRNLGEALGIQGVYGREIPGGAAQMLRMPLNPKKHLASLTVRALSNDVIIGLMAVTLQH